MTCIGRGLEPSGLATRTVSERMLGPVGVWVRRIAKAMSTPLVGSGRYGRPLSAGGLPAKHLRPPSAGALRAGVEAQAESSAPVTAVIDSVAPDWCGAATENLPGEGHEAEHPFRLEPTVELPPEQLRNSTGGRWHHQKLAKSGYFASAQAPV